SSIRTLEDVGYNGIKNRFDRRGFKTTNHYIIHGLPDKYINLKICEGEPSMWAKSEKVGGLNWDYRPKWLWDMFVKFGKVCPLSGLGENITIDHLLPRGTNDMSGRKGKLIPLNSVLNSSTGNKNIFEGFDYAEVKYNIHRDRFNAVITEVAKENG